jgi:hypothetical protein
LADLVVADFTKSDTIQTKIGTVHPKFGEKIRIGQARFFSTCRIFKHGVQPTNLHALVIELIAVGAWGTVMMNVFAHETNRDWKPLLKVVETGLSSLINQMVRFCQDQ